MTDTTQNQLVTEIAYDLIAQTAPEELSLFTVTSTAYFKNPHQVRKELESKDEKLGFGAGVITALAPIIITIVDGVLKYVIEELLPQEIKESGIIGNIFRKKQRVNNKVELPMSLTREQMQLIHDQAIKSALQYKLTRTQADQLATNLVGRLALVTK